MLQELCHKSPLGLECSYRDSATDSKSHAFLWAPKNRRVHSKATDESYLCAFPVKARTPPAIDGCHTAPPITAAGVMSLNSEKMKNKVNTTGGRNHKEEEKVGHDEKSRITRMTRPQTERCRA